MYQCTQCQRFVGPRIHQVLRFSYRETIHPPKYREDEFGDKVMVDPGGPGRQIAGQTVICPICAGQMDPSRFEEYHPKANKRRFGPQRVYVQLKRTEHDER